jgi:hypothetical protein
MARSSPGHSSLRNIPTSRHDINIIASGHRRDASCPNTIILAPRDAFAPLVYGSIVTRQPVSSASANGAAVQHRIAAAPCIAIIDV